MFSMQKKPAIYKGVGVGLAVGAMAAAASYSMMSSGSGMKACKKGAVKCVKSMEEIMSGIASMMK